jgi:hypothetical protein
MAALDFPNSPSVGQIFTDTAGTQWKWDGVKWVPAGAGGAGTVTSVTAGTGLTGGTITTSGTIALGVPVPVADGGTGDTTLTANAILIGAGTSPIVGSAATLTPAGALSIPSTSLTQGAATFQSTASFAGAITPTGGIQGITNGSNAAAGQIGEYISATIPTTTLSASTWTTTSTGIALTPGDWDVWGFGAFDGQGTGCTQMVAGITPTLNGSPGQTASVALQGATLGLSSLTVPMLRVNITASATYYIGFYAAYTGGLMHLSGFLQARRAR